MQAEALGGPSRHRVSQYLARLGSLASQQRVQPSAGFTGTCWHLLCCRRLLNLRDAPPKML